MAVIVLTFIQKAIVQGIGILFGSIGEIITEKVGNLNLGIPGLMYMGGIAGLVASFLYESSVSNPIPFVGFLAAIFASLLVSGCGAALYSYLTISLRSNQNVVGLALTTFGIGFGNFFGGSISKLAGGVGQISVASTASAFKAVIPFLSDIPVLGKLLFSYGFLTYFALILAFFVSFVLLKTRIGLNIRAIGENPSCADTAGINIEKYKYAVTIAGGAIAGLGGLYFVMEYLGGTWTNNGFGDRGWLAVALVIFSMWDCRKAVLGSFLFGALYILYLYIPGLSRSMQELFKMSPYVVTVGVLIFTSIRASIHDDKENQPPEHLGLAYFREER